MRDIARMLLPAALLASVVGGQSAGRPDAGGKAVSGEEALKKAGLVPTVAKLLQELDAVKARLDDAEKRVAELKKRPAVLMAGWVDEKGKLVRSVGAGCEAKQEMVPVLFARLPRYRLTFAKVLKRPPLVVATSDGGSQGSRAEVRDVTEKDFVIEGRTYQGNGLAAIAFSFVVIEAE